MAKPTVLIILDGWGYREDPEHNAIASANTPVWDELWQNYSHCLIEGSGDYVGLPDGQMGNSEVGHLNLGSGRIVYQDISRINKSIEDASFKQNPALCEGIDKALQNDKAIHIMGLLSPGGVHSHEDHFHAIIELAANKGAKKVYIHAFLDGRDTPPQSATDSIQKLDAKLEQLACGQIASIIGRYYAMDRDQRWERVEQAYNLMCQGTAKHHAETALQGLEQAYARGENDEFVSATSIHAPNKEQATINDGDCVVFMNFRADRARQLSRAFAEPGFSGFTRKKTPEITEFISLTQYATDIPTTVAFPPASLDNVLGEFLSKKGLTQLRIAETEKYAHVTFFFNGGVEQPFPGEERYLIPSPKVATYDLQPEMHAQELTQKLVEAIKSQKFDTIICNYANPDMVGHTGNFDATVKAIETIDACLGQIKQALAAAGGEMLITADHGNAEKMFDETTGQAHTAHTTEPVPLIYFGRQAECVKVKGSLSDIAPTLLHLMGLKPPIEMTGQALFRIVS